MYVAMSRFTVANNVKAGVERVFRNVPILWTGPWVLSVWM